MDNGIRILVSCSQCNHFIKDEIGDGFGIGKCKKYSDYKAKGVSEDGLRAALRNLGNDPITYGHLNEVFWGGTKRNRECEKYEK